MAKDKRIFEINLSSITQNGATCKNPKITWEKPECANIRCGVVDGKTLTIEIPADCPDPCAYVIIDCTDDCALCDPVRVKVCPCDVDVDCADCEGCVNGMCVTTCAINEFCLDDGICGECDDTHPCEGNKICVNGSCDCPPDMPYEDSKGNCSECDENHPCPPCFVCTPNGCIPKECLNCDAVTGNCVECFSNTDCTGANECCVGDSCECCDGFILDVTTGNCIPRPDCLRDTDCATCQTCNDGTCVDTVCPPGFIRIPGMPCCVLECNCDDPSCPRSEECIRLDQDNCYCAPCSGACDMNSDCGDGCYCDNGQCKPNPCHGACNDGFDCGDGCGCDNGTCVPCSSLNCSNNDCSNVDGCYCAGNSCIKKSCGGDCDGVTDCPPGCACFQEQCVDCNDLDCDACKFAAGCDCFDETTCISTPCVGDCNDANDCDGVDCGCDKAKQSCVSCLAYTCSNGNVCPDGCICKDGDCVGNPCNSVDCSSDIDCGQGCECIGGKCQPCADGDPNCGNYSGCSDLLMVTKIDETCDLKATLTTKNCCNCDDISVGLKLNNVEADGSHYFKFTGELQLRGGTQSATWAEFIGKQFLRDFQDQVFPVSGKYDITLEEEYGGTNGKFVNSRTITVDMTGDDEYTVLQTPKIEFLQVAVPGQIYTIGGSVRTHIKTTIKLASKGAVVLENGCISHLPSSNVAVFGNDVQAMQNMTSLSMFSHSFEMMKDNNCKKPKLTWYRNTVPTLVGATIINTAWMDLVGVVGTSSLYDTKLETVADGLLYGKYFWAQPGCSCWLGITPYSCSGPGGSPSPLVFDPVYTLNFVISDCCKKVTFEEVSIRCDVMTDASPGAKYVLYINGVATATEYTLLSTGILIPNGTMYTHTSVINTVGLKPKLAACNTSLVTKSGTCLPFDSDFSFIVDTCYTTGDISINITTTNAAVGLKTYSIDNGIDSAVTGTFLGNSVTVPNVPAQDATYTVTITLADGCEDITTHVLDLTSYNSTLQLTATTGCSGGSSYIRFANGYNELAAVDMNSTTYYVPANGYLTVVVDSNTPFNYDYYVVSTPSCHIAKTGEVVICCSTIDYDLVTVTPITCLSATEIEFILENNETFPAIFSFEDSLGNVLGSEVTVLPSGIGVINVTLGITNTNVVFKVRADIPGTCPKSTIHTFDGSSCAGTVLDNITASYTCSAGNGGNGVGKLRVVDTNSRQVSHKVYVNNSLVFNGIGNYDWDNIPQPGDYAVRIELPSGAYKDTALHIDCRV